MKYTALIITLFILACMGTNAYSQAIHQLEEITGQTIDRGNYGYYNYDVPPAPMPDQTYYNDQFTSFMAGEAAKENNKGVDYYNQKNWSKAVQQFKKASNMNPDNGVYKTNLENAQRMLEIEKEIEQKNKDLKKTDQIFVKSFNADVKTHTSNVNGIRKTIASYVPPLEGQFPKKIHEGVILGLYNTQDKNMVKNLKSPFTGKPYKPDEYFATTNDTSNMELLRGVIDNGSLGKYTLNSAYGKQLVEKLQGTHFDRLVAHSNGATVSEALIREGVIEVDELNIIGGDRSLINYYGYHDLVASGKVKRIVVWLNPGDIIPYGSSAGLISPLNGSREQYLKSFAAYFDYKLKGTNADNQVEYRFMKGPQFERGQTLEFNKKIFDAHGVDAYYDNMNTWFGN
jgi:hypothetical protein